MAIRSRAHPVHCGNCGVLAEIDMIEVVENDRIVDWFPGDVRCTNPDCPGSPPQDDAEG